MIVGAALLPAFRLRRDKGYPGRAFCAMKQFKLFAHTGVRWILLSALLALAVFAKFGGWAALPVVLVMFALMLFYRDPERQLPSHPLGVMSPADGVVVLVDLFYDPFIKRPSARIRLRCGAFRAYHDRSPTEGRVMEYWPALGEAQGYDRRNACAAWWIRTDEGDDVVVVASAKPLWGKPISHAQAGERVGQARRYARFPVFCDVDVLVDDKSFIDVRQGMHVSAGVDTLATLNHDAHQDEVSRPLPGHGDQGLSAKT